MKTFIVEYLNGNLRHMARNGRSLPIKAPTQEQAVINLFGAPADSWDGNHFTKWDGKLRARIEEIAR